MSDSEVARDVSYAASALTLGGRLMIRLVENMTGRFQLIRRAEGYQAEVARGGNFWQVLVDRYGLGLDVIGGSLASIPAKGPVVLVANHPYGILDGLMMGHILAEARGDFRILANSVFRRSAELTRVILPISFDETKAALAQNLETRCAALDYLASGGAIGVFPGGTVSTPRRPFGPPMDPAWRSFTAKMIARSGATVVPVYFEGQNSRFFQIASHLHQTLRLALLLKEFQSRLDQPVRVVIGKPIAPTRLAAFRTDPKAMMDFLRRTTYELSPIALRSYDYGYEFEAKHRD